MKKVLLINPSIIGTKGVNPSTNCTSLGLAYLASYLKGKGSISYDIKILDANILQMSNQQVLKILEEFSPLIVGIYMNVILAGNGLKLSQEIKKRYPKTLVCIGGPTVSSNPKETLTISNADVAVFGEGEATFLEICEGKQLDTIKGIAYLKDKKVVLNEPRLLIEDIDTIPFPAYDLLPDLRVYKSRARKSPAGAIITSRGCPFHCTFCNASVFGKKFRTHSPEYIIKQIDMLVKEYGVRQLDILDDNLLLDRSRAERIFDLIIQRDYKLAINLQTGTRVENLDEEFIKKMKRAGVFKTGIGIESANPEVLKSIKKSLDLNKVAQAIHWFKKHGIITYGFFIIGFPNDTKESINQTIDFAVKTDLSIANFMILVPFPGTELYDSLKKDNLLVSQDMFYYDTGYYENEIRHKPLYLSNKELLELQKKAYSKFFFRISKAIEMWSDVRSFNEFRWNFFTSLAVLKGVVFNKEKPNRF